MTHAAPYTLRLSVWVPSGTARKWTPCPLMADSITDELVLSCTEVKSVIRAYAKLVARILSASHARYDGFRIVGRCKATGELVAAQEWQRSPETHQLVPFPVTWTACPYVHPYDKAA